MKLGNFGHDFATAIVEVAQGSGFALTVICTLAIAIGANLAVFRVLHGVLFARLPISQPSQLYSLHAVKSPFDAQWFFSYPAYQRLRQQMPGSVIARSGISDAVLQVPNGFSQQASFQLVSDNFFAVLGISPSAGRFFRQSDDTPGQSELPVVLAYGFAKEHFGSDRSIIGMKAVLNRTRSWSSV